MAITGTYSSLSAEYYDAKRHPTCANFRELSIIFLDWVLKRFVKPEMSVLEVGAGKSVVAPILLSNRIAASLLLADSSPEMLSYSRDWVSENIKLVLADARSTKLRSASVDFLVAALADPYNDAEFWTEVARILRHNGMCAITLPAYEWASSFRSGEEKNLARFELVNGEVVDVPSYVYPLAAQLELIGPERFQLVELVSFTNLAITNDLSPKLVSDAVSPVLTGLVLRKAA